MPDENPSDIVREVVFWTVVICIIYIIWNAVMGR